jgi:hypothetical protein
VFAPLFIAAFSAVSNKIAVNNPRMTKSCRPKAAMSAAAHVTKPWSAPQRGPAPPSALPAIHPPTAAPAIVAPMAQIQSARALPRIMPVHG